MNSTLTSPAGVDATPAPQPIGEHEALVVAAQSWLNSKVKCPVIITEMTSESRETPDAIGWKRACAWLVECKTSRADYFADRRKMFRQYAKDAMGTYRYYLTRPGLLKPEEVAEPWGLLELHGKRIRKVKEATAVVDGNRKYEIDLLVSALRRVAATPGVKGMRVKVYTIEGAGDPRATISASLMTQPAKDSQVLLDTPA